MEIPLKLYFCKCQKRLGRAEKYPNAWEKKIKPSILLRKKCHSLTHSLTYSLTHTLTHTHTQGGRYIVEFCWWAFWQKSIIIRSKRKYEVKKKKKKTNKTNKNNLAYLQHTFSLEQPSCLAFYFFFHSFQKKKYLIHFLSRLNFVSNKV